VVEANRSLASVEEKSKNWISAINEYHEFIEKYPEKLLTRVALHECFELYCQIDRISFYHNFIQRYPYTEYSLVAREHIKRLLFALVCTQDSIIAYGKFLTLFPEPSFYQAKCVEFAEKKTVEEEKAISEKLKTFEERNKRANVLIHECNKVLKEYSEAGLEHRVSALLSDRKIKRILRQISECYPDTFASNTLFLLESNKIILEMAQEIKDSQKKQHDEVLAALKSHFDSLDRMLKENFGAMEQNFQQVNQKLSQLQDDLHAGYATLLERFDKVDAKLDKIDLHIQEGFAQVNQKLDVGFARIENHFQVLHNDLRHINQSMIQMSYDLGTGFAQLSEDNRKFLQQNSTVLATLEENGRIYTGYQNIPRRSGFQSALGKSLGIALTFGVAAIPVAGPMGAAIAAPVCNWLGETLVDKAASLWNRIF
jgi:hypothetical protein